MINYSFQDISVIQLSGGLGNQLFQLALGISSFGQAGRDFLFDPGYFHKKAVKRSLEIDILLHEDCFLPINKSRKSNLSFRFKFREKNRILFDPEFFGMEMFTENRKLFDSSIFYKKGVYYKGTFIHPAYWGGKTSETIDEVNSLIEQSSVGRLSSGIKKSILGIHIRRGDYLTNHKTRNFHGLCSFEYYKNAFSCIKNLDDFDQVIIFSDDKSVAKRFRLTIGLASPPIYIDDSRRTLELLVKMSRCDTFIGCNSTLSWWAAYLGKDKVRILPENWFLDSHVTLDPRLAFFPFDTELISNVLTLKEDLP